MSQLMYRVAPLIGLFLISESALTGPLLDYIRNYDLNDYALGVAVSTEQNPHIGAGNGTFAYPYLTTFHHSSMTDDWFLVRDGELGFRRVTDNGWELGAIGRIQTLGPLGHEQTQGKRVDAVVDGAEAGLFRRMLRNIFGKATAQCSATGVRGVCSSSELVPAQSCWLAVVWWIRIRGAATEGNVCQKVRESCVT